MFVQNTKLLLILIGMAGYVSTASGQQLDSIGRMPEITVTAPRYEFQDEAWAGLIEGVIVEARRSSSKEPVITTAERESCSCSVSMSLYSEGSSYVFLSLVLTLTIVPLSLISMSVRAHLGGKEVENDRTDN